MNTTMDACPSHSVVDVQGLVKSYGGRRVVDHLDLTIAPGEIVALIGANGAGKTTTVECLQGLRRPDAGRLSVLGLNPTRDADRLRPQVGSQLQSSALPDRLRVSEAVRLFATSRAQDGDELLERFGLGERRRSAFAGMSGGEQQRLFLVLALLNRPRLVILDELTQGLDPAARREVWAAVAQLRDDGTTVLLVTHELDAAESLCERVVVMKAGRVLDQGRPAELVTRHAGGITIRFSQPSATVHDNWAPIQQTLQRLRGVHHARLNGDRRIEVQCDREAIAHVGAWLVGLGGEIPSDLDVRAPDLETALIRLLADPHK